MGTKGTQGTQGNSGGGRALQAIKVEGTMGNERNCSRLGQLERMRFPDGAGALWETEGLCTD